MKCYTEMESVKAARTHWDTQQRKAKGTCEWRDDVVMRSENQKRNSKDGNRLKQTNNKIVLTYCNTHKNQRDCEASIITCETEANI